MDAKEQVGSRIKALRVMRGYSQERLAEITGANPKYLSSIERGKENPTLEFLIRLATGLRVNLQEIFYIQDIGESPRVLRKKLKALANDVKDTDLIRILRVIEVLLRS